MEEENPSPECKNLSPNHQSEFPLGKIVAAHKVYNEPSKSTFLHILEPFKL